MARSRLLPMAGLLTRGSPARRAFPADEGQWQKRRASPLTVAWAATDLAPLGSTAPCSLFSPGGLRPATAPSARMLPDTGPAGKTVSGVLKARGDRSSRARRRREFELDLLPVPVVRRPLQVPDDAIPVEFAGAGGNRIPRLMREADGMAELVTDDARELALEQLPHIRSLAEVLEVQGCFVPRGTGERRRLLARGSHRS
jgi:hypothetical protein